MIDMLVQEYKTIVCYSGKYFLQFEPIQKKFRTQVQ
jgi:hypothetical protein